jgi:hypothetical protein
LQIKDKCLCITCYFTGLSYCKILTKWLHLCFLIGHLHGNWWPIIISTIQTTERNNFREWVRLEDGWHVLLLVAVRVWGTKVKHLCIHSSLLNILANTLPSFCDLRIRIS